MSPEFQPVNRHTCGANSSQCITVVGLSPGIRPVGAGLCPPTWVAGANSSATEVSPEPSPAGHRDGSTWGRDATGPEPTPAPRWSRPPQTKPHAPNPSPQPSHKLVWDGSLLRLVGEKGFFFILPSLFRAYSRSSTLFWFWRRRHSAWRTPGLWDRTQGITGRRLSIISHLPRLSNLVTPLGYLSSSPVVELFRVMATPNHPLPSLIRGMVVVTCRRGC